MKKLETMTAEQLQSAPYAPVPFLVDELLPEGLHILAGAPKIGKSWLALWLCLCVSQGQPLWNFAVTQGEVLYLSLEDSYRRIQSRLFDLTEDAPSALHFAIMADTLKHGLEQQIEQFLTEHPATKLVVIDTLQRVRSAGGDSNLYANDYQDVGLLKQLADKHHIAILLIHHLRKLHDDDPMNMISGSTGLSGAADSAFVLQKNARSANAASLHCTGRDIPDRTLKLELCEDDHIWKLLADSKTCSGASKISALQLVHLFSALLLDLPARWRSAGFFSCAAHTPAAGVQSRTQRRHAPHGAVQALDLLAGSIGSIFPTVGRSALSALRSEISRLPLLR